jgi:hypothetical protein
MSHVVQFVCDTYVYFRREAHAIAGHYTANLMPISTDNILYAPGNGCRLGSTASKSDQLWQHTESIIAPGVQHLMLHNSVSGSSNFASTCQPLATAPANCTACAAINRCFMFCITTSDCSLQSCAE